MTHNNKKASNGLKKIIILSTFLLLITMNANASVSNLLERKRGIRCGDIINGNITLENDLLCNGNAISLSNNATLDCNGHSISPSIISEANSHTGRGINLDGINNFTISNCNIHGFEYGIYLNNSSNGNINSNILDNTINAYENENSLNNNWSQNSWSDFPDNSGYPDTYIVDGPGNGIDNEPGMIVVDLTCGSIVNNSVILGSDIICQDQQFGIKPGIDNITINCNGHSISKPTRTGKAVYLQDRNGITLRNCNLQNFEVSIYIQNSSNNNIINNTLTNSSYSVITVGTNNDNTFHNNTFSNIFENGIQISEANNLILSNNTFHNAGTLTVLLVNTSSSTISHNTFLPTTDSVGVNLNNASYNNLITNNEFNGLTYGIGITGPQSNGNKVLNNLFTNMENLGAIIYNDNSSTTFANNSFINNNLNARVEGTSGVSTFWEQDESGNYWSNHNCIDYDNNGICENSYIFEGDTDYHPLANSTWNINNILRKPITLIKKKIKTIEDLIKKSKK
ncbi:MAG: NosD domain-containing protein [Patescibacteria group bacterium]|nr:NosD domain-containing protein [Patescibacteria group bacterium]MDD4304195.1 NosD domain-containing protein [Patescibacteria group bacterium]MDD4695227.1 NosD domain-containing protein [Patescibacteria group bacterium]